MSPTALALLSLAIAAINGAIFFARMQRVALQKSRIVHDLAWTAALAIGVAALARGPGWLFGSLAALAVAASSVMLLLRLGSAQAKSEPAVRVGGPILDFTAPDADGAPFALASLAGTPFLLKFFRGHW